MASPFAAPAFVAKVLVAMQLLRAGLVLSAAIPSSRVVANALGTAAPAGAHAQAKPVASFLQRAGAPADLAKFNEEAEAIHKKIDSLALQCKMMQMKDEDTLSGLNREMRAVSGQLAGNVALESSAVGETKQLDDQMGKLTQQLQSAKDRCNAEKKHYNASVEMLIKDAEKSKALRSLSSQCGAAALAAIHASVSAVPLMESTSLLQGCKEEVVAPMRAATKEMEQVARDFNTPFAKQAFSEALQLASAGSTFPALLATDKDWPSKSKPASAAKKKAAGSCKMSEGSVNCDLLKSQLETMAQHLEDQKDAAVSNQRKQVDQCVQKEKDLNDRIKSTSAQHARASAELVRLTGLKAGLAASRASIQQRLERSERDAKKFQKTCKEGISEYNGELEEILAKRQAEANSAAPGGKVLIHDCKVTNWIASKCSKACKAQPGDAAGEMNFTRSITQASGLDGTSCPPLTAKLPCNDKPCPTDCVVTQWTKWGACSKACAGGTKKRTREVTTQAKDGGKSCPGIEMRKACNVGRCGDECKLKEWTAWSPCSRRCKFSKNSASGRSTRVREVIGNPMSSGGGSPCPPADDKTRLQTRACNKEVCPKGITCDAAEDVLFLLDGSGDPESGPYDEQLQLVYHFAEASSKKVAVGVMSYGKEVKIISRITADRNALDAIWNYLPPAGGTRDSTKGIVVGRTLFADPGIGAEGRPKIAVLLLGGSPASYVNAKKAADEIKAAGVRLVVGLIDSGDRQARDHACGLASAPCSANVEAVKSWEQLAAEPGRFLAAICRDLVYPTPAPSQMEKMAAR